MQRRETDEQKRIREEKEAYQQREKDALTKDFSDTFATSSGIKTLRAIMKACGYQSSSTVADPSTGEIQLHSTAYNEGRRNMYLWIRKLVSKETLIAVELGGLESDEE
jgi:hypothetical protein